MDQAERGGDFSELSTQLVNPVTGANYPNNQVPVNPVIANYIARYLPLPNGPDNTYTSSPTASINDDQGITHFDYNLSTKDTFSFVYVVDNSSDFFPEEGGSISATSGALPSGPGEGGNVPVGSGGTDGQRTQIGTFTADASAPAAPTIFTPSFDLGPSIQGPTTLHRATFEWSDDYTWTFGHHEIKFGGDVTRVRQNFYYDYYNSGGFDFTDGFFTGDEYADFVGGFWDTCRTPGR